MCLEETTNATSTKKSHGGQTGEGDQTKVQGSKFAHKHVSIPAVHVVQTIKPFCIQQLLSTFSLIGRTHYRLRKAENTLTISLP